MAIIAICIIAIVFIERRRLLKIVEKLEKQYPRAWKRYLSVQRVKDIRKESKDSLKKMLSVTTWQADEEKLTIQEGIFNNVDGKIRRAIESEKKRSAKEEAEKRKKYKDDKDAIIERLRQNGIACFYHFTAIENVKSIRNQGGLFSTHQLDQKCRSGEILDFVPGSTDDKAFRTELQTPSGGYVHLSFCTVHPQAVKKYKIGTSQVLLYISTDVATWRDTIFTDRNLFDGIADGGDDLNGLDKVQFDVATGSYVKKGDPNYHIYQAEIMVKDFIPARYILNIDRVASLDKYRSLRYYNPDPYKWGKYGGELMPYSENGEPLMLSKEEVQIIVIERFETENSLDVGNNSTITMPSIGTYRDFLRNSDSHQRESLNRLYNHLYGYRLHVKFNTDSKFPGDTWYMISNEMKPLFDDGLLKEGMSFQTNEVVLQDYSHPNRDDVTLAFVRVPTNT